MLFIQTHTVGFRGLRVQSLRQDGLHKAVIRVGASLLGYSWCFFFGFWVWAVRRNISV